MNEAQQDWAIDDIIANPDDPLNGAIIKLDPTFVFSKYSKYEFRYDGAL